jgi:RNA polymerase-binding protein DksA
MNFSSAQITSFRNRLDERAEQLREEVRDGKRQSREETHARLAEQARDTGDDSFADLTVDMRYFDMDRDTAELQLIDLALMRLSEGTYGRCVDCGQDIGLSRLEVEPTAQRCIRCQELHEKTHASVSTPRL